MHRSHEICNHSKIGKTFINYLKTMKQGEHEILTIQ